MDLIDRAALLKKLRKERDDYVGEHFVTDPETGSSESSSAKEDYANYLDETIEAIEAFPAIKPLPEKMAPVQGYAAGIPWSMHMRAYDVYCKRYGGQQALIEGGCRGGFGVGELDMFIPGWRAELAELTKLKMALKRIDSINDNPARFNSEINDVIVGALGALT